MPSSSESANFCSGFAGLGLQSQASPQLQHNDHHTGVSPREVTESSTVVDEDSFDDLDLSDSFRGRNLTSSSSGGGQIIYQDPLNSSSSRSEQAQSQQTEFSLDLEDDIEASMATICAFPVSRSSGGWRIGLQRTQSHLRGDAVMHFRDIVRDEMWDGPANAPVESAIHHHFIRRLMKQDRRLSLQTAFIGCVKSESPVLGSASLQGGGWDEIEQDEVEDEIEDEVEDEDRNISADGHDDYVEQSAITNITPTPPSSSPPWIRSSTLSQRPPPHKAIQGIIAILASTSLCHKLFQLCRPTSETKKGGAAVEKKVKAVKWESTKPKRWIPECFDPWWD
ncbi:hypothetical protein FRB96_003852 [Tulasnella sp. 330]|nr:hypothetical protein FRB96_003852 [Tulasnella sp. 330]